MELPKFHETFQPILETLKDRRILTTRELIDTVIKQYYSQLNPDLLEQKTKSGENLLTNRIAWGKSYLKKGEFISFPERGRVQITDKGLSNISNISLNEVVNTSDFLTFYNTENQKIKISTNSSDVQIDSPQDLIDKGFQQIEANTKTELLEKLKGISPYYFEKVILILLKKVGVWGFY